VSPLLVNDMTATIREAARLRARAALPNLLIKIPGTPPGLGAIADTTAAGAPVDVTLLFSGEQYQAVANAYMCGLERRVAAGPDPTVGSGTSSRTPRPFFASSSAASPTRALTYRSRSDALLSTFLAESFTQARVRNLGSPRMNH